MNARRSPWLWVPSLYFSQGIPYVMVMTLSVIMYKRLGISNTDLALYTSWLYLPWVIKPLWSPLVDITRTKRGWIVTLQFLVAVALALVAFTIPGTNFFCGSLALFWLMAFASATHDIAADGFYMLGLSPHEQVWWVGLRSTFYRAAMIVGSGLLVVLAGELEERNGLPPVTVTVTAGDSPLLPALPNPATLHFPVASGPLHLLVQPANLEISCNPRSANQGGNVGQICFSLSQPPPAGKPVTVHFARQLSGLEKLGFNQGDHGFHLVTGDQFTFNATNWNQPAVAVIQLAPTVTAGTSVVFATTSGNLPLAWAITLFTVAGLFLAFSLWHTVMLPRPPGDGPVVTHRNWLAEFKATFGTFFAKPGLGLSLAFILLYRFDEAQLSKVISPFLLDGRAVGGLGLGTSQVGLIYGTFGILALTIGGLLGGFLAARHGLKKMLPWLVGAMYLPKLAFVFLSWVQPENLLVTGATVAVEQFGYGLGFTAFMLYLLYFARGPHQTAHYAICTGFMALGMMLPGMWSGWLADTLGYRHFFIWVIFSALPGLVLALQLKIEPQFGKKSAAA